MKFKCKKTFYNRRKIYVIGQSYDTDSLDKSIVEEYFEQPTKKPVKKKRVRKPKPEVKEDKTAETVEVPKEQPAKAKVAKTTKVEKEPEVVKAENLEPLEENASEE